MWCSPCIRMVIKTVNSTVNISICGMVYSNNYMSWSAHVQHFENHAEICRYPACHADMQILRKYGKSTANYQFL